MSAPPAHQGFDVDHAEVCLSGDDQPPGLTRSQQGPDRAGLPWIASSTTSEIWSRSCLGGLGDRLGGKQNSHSP